MSVKGGGLLPNSVKEKSAKKQLFLAQKTPILALFDPFVEENFQQFSVNWGRGGTIRGALLDRNHAKQEWESVGNLTAW